MDIKKIGIGLAAAALALCVAGGPVLSQGNTPRVGQRFGDWTFQCQATSATENVCGIIQNVADKGTRQQVLSVGIRYLGPERKLAMFVTVPLGIFLGAGIGGKIDAGETFAFLWQACTPRGCQAAIEVTEPLRGQLAKGQKLLIGFKPTAQAATLTVPVSLNGFTDGLAALPAK